MFFHTRYGVLRYRAPPQRTASGGMDKHLVSKLFFDRYSPRLKEGCIALWWTCLSVCLHILKTTRPNFTKFSMCVACGVPRFSSCNTLWTSGFVTASRFHIMALWCVMCIPDPKPDKIITALISAKFCLTYGSASRPSSLFCKLGQCAICDCLVYYIFIN